MVRIRSAVGIFLVLALTGCLSKVYIDYDQTADFSKYRTFAWGKGTPTKNPLMDRRIATAIEEQLSGKGFQKVNGNPDMFISYHAASTEEVSYSTTSYGYNYGPAWETSYGRYGGGLEMWGVGLSSGTAMPVKIVKGTLVVDIYGADRKLLLWRGTGKDAVQADPEKMENRIHQVITEMFAKFPPSA